MQSPDIIISAWQDALTRLARALDGTATTPEDGLFELHSRVPVPNLNGLLVTDPSLDDGVITDAIASFQAAGPWSVQVRTAPTEAIVAAAAARGLETLVPLPLMTRGLDDELTTELPEGVTVRAMSAGDHAVYSETLADGFGAPRAVLAALGDSAVLGADGMRGFLVESGGRPLATAFAVRTDDTVAITNVAVLPEHRRRGLGTIATRAALDYARASGARSAYLHASALGLPVYRRLGFTVAEEWTMFV